MNNLNLKQNHIYIMRLNKLLKISLISLILVFVGFLILIIPKINQEIPVIEILNFSTDKNTYSSHEEMKILVLLKSPKEIENVTLNVWGIKPYSYAYINESKTLNLKRGENEIVFLTKTPYCTSGCGGVHPGPYEIYVKVFVNGKETANSSTKINLVQG
jgi:hypothetical protein